MRFAGLGPEISISLVTFPPYLALAYPLHLNFSHLYFYQLAYPTYFLSRLSSQKMPSVISSTPPPSIRGGHEKARPRGTQPSTYSGSLDSYEQHDSTPSIGREIPTLQINKILNAPDADTLIRDLAITGKISLLSTHFHSLTSSLVSERGVIFLRNQDANTEELLAFGKKLSKLTGSVSLHFCPVKSLIRSRPLLTRLFKPDSSGLHIHPITEAGSELGDQISVISSVKQKKGAAPVVDPLTEPSKFASNAWHADITFEPVPSDYALLKIHTLPPTGGDTVSSRIILSGTYKHNLTMLSYGHRDMKYTTDSLPLRRLILKD